jgi:purine-nucleoside phosphorylase
VTPFGAAAARHAAHAITERAGNAPPLAAFILGSGLGRCAARIADAVTIEYADVPGYPVPGVAGHAGRVVLGTLGGRRVVAFDGRVHAYEGRGSGPSGFPVRVAHALGARTLVVTNAAGGIRADLRAGDLMVIHDHINFTFRNALIGRAERGDERFPDMSAPYDPQRTAALLAAARAIVPRATTGVYAGVLGPSYETPAEVRALARLGADAVGMSTVPEVVVARAISLRVVGLALISNLAAGIGERLSHDAVLAASASAADAIAEVLASFVATLSLDGEAQAK